MIVRVTRGIPNFSDVFTPETAVAASQLGTPIYDRVIIPAGSYVDTRGETISYERVILDDVLLTVNLQRNISVTKIVGRQGTVKEYISNGDYEINFTGRIVAPWQYEPTGSLFNLSQIFKVEQEIPVNCKFLNTVFDITDMVIIGKPQIAQVEGSRNTCTFSFRAISYEDIQLEVLDDENINEVGLGADVANQA